MIEIFGGGVLLLAIVVLAIRYFPNQVSDFFNGLRGSPTSAVKKQSDEMLAAMDRNVAERAVRVHWLDRQSNKQLGP